MFFSLQQFSNGELFLYFSSTLASSSSSLQFSKPREISFTIKKVKAFFTSELSNSEKVEENSSQSHSRRRDSSWVFFQTLKSKQKRKNQNPQQRSVQKIKFSTEMLVLKAKDLSFISP